MDGVPAYVVKNNRTGKKKVLHQARLLLWLADIGKPVRSNLMTTSDTLLGMIPENQLPLSDDGSIVPGSVQYGLNLTMFQAIIDYCRLL